MIHPTYNLCTSSKKTNYLFITLSRRMKPLLSQLKNKLLFRQNPVIRYSQRQRHRTCLTNSPTNDNKHSSSSFVNNKAFLLSLMTIPLIYMILSSNESEANKSSTTNTKDVEIIKIPSATIIQLSSNLSQFYDELQKSLQSDQIDFTASEREARGKPWNSYHHIDRDPCVVVFPQSTEDVSTILKLCFKYKVPGINKLIILNQFTIFK